MIKIGILYNDLSSFENWELRIIKKLLEKPSVHLIRLVGENQNKARGQNQKNLKVFADNLLKKQESIERKRYLRTIKTLEAQPILSSFKKTPHIDLKSIVGNKTSKDSVENNLKETSKVDVILQFNSTSVNKEYLIFSKHGIWQMQHSKLSLEKGNPSGFWEVLLKKPVVEILLLQYKTDVSTATIVDKAYVNINPISYVITERLAKEASVSFLLKNILNLGEIGSVEKEQERLVINTEQIKFNVIDVFRYLFKFYAGFLKNKVENGVNFSHKKKHCWTIFIGEGNFLEADLSKLKPVKMPKNEFWADPFLFSFENETYLFFEKYPFSTKRGIISCGKVKGNDLIDIQDVLVLPYHLSYPFVFEENGEIFMMPETNENNRLEIYRCKEFPTQWELYSTAFEGEALADASFFIDDLQQKWLFFNKSSGADTTLDNELHIYKVNGSKLDNLEAHRQNPIYIDSRIARNGGSIFKHNNEWFRPSQRNVEGVYGKALNINRIKKLNIQEYEEEIFKIIEPNFQKKLSGVHHLCQSTNKFVLDAALTKF